jgi:hypothetical protein
LNQYERDLRPGLAPPIAPVQRANSAKPSYAAPVRRQKTRWEEDNEIPVNWGAFAAVGALVAGLVGLAVLIALT